MAAPKSDAAPVIAVIGAGFSGSLLSLQLLRRCPAPVRVALIERNLQFGRGQAYATANPSHLLNVPAGRMSAFRDRPHDFLNWLQAQPAETLDGVEASEGSFAPRSLFGAYIRHLLNEELKRDDLGDRFELIRGDVQSIDQTGPRTTLDLGRNRVLQADIAVLAVGNFPPEPVPIADMGFYDSPLYRADPWSPDSYTDLDPTAPVLIIGTGLTMVDAVISLIDQGHTGTIHAISRRGLVPRRHLAGPVPTAAAPGWSLPSRVAALTRLLRADADKAVAEGRSWQPVMDGLRPFTQEIWQAMPQPEQSRFLRHLRPWWDVHRHRIAPAVADRTDAARAGFQLCIQPGRIRSMEVSGGVVAVRFRPRGGEALETIRVARVINCSGPCCDYARIAHPLVRCLMENGLVRPDALSLGLDVSTTCALLDRDGAISRRLFAVGPVTKGAFWEMTAVPDLRRQCEDLAAHLAAVIQPKASSSGASGTIAQR
ncbi:MAG TPA: FAD/NAD(P)-binding protein [Acetobacteraceae bacterium]|jgi:uncharacterized NAD(P)/FAD-binding protein YdhS